MTIRVKELELELKRRSEQSSGGVQKHEPPDCDRLPGAAPGAKGELTQSGRHLDPVRSVAVRMEDLGDEAPDLSGIAVDNVVGLYLREMSQVPLLDPEEEVALSRQMERGRKARRRLARGRNTVKEKVELERAVCQGQQARNHLVEANTRLVVSVAKNYVGYGLPLSDLIQAGNLGLIKAVDKYDHRRGTRFSTHATWWIRQAVSRALRNQGRTIRLPVYLSERIGRLEKTSQRLEQDLRRRPTREELAEEEGLELDAVDRLLEIVQQPLSLDMPVGEDQRSTLGDLIEDEYALSADERAECHLLRETVEGALSTVSPREARVLHLRYGLVEDARQRTLKEVGRELGVSKERIRQIQRRALDKLRVYLN